MGSGINRRDARGIPPLFTHHPSPACHLILTYSYYFSVIRSRMRHRRPQLCASAPRIARRGALRACPDSVNDQPPETPKYGWAFFRTPLTHFEQQEKIKKRSGGALLYYVWARCSSCGSRDHARLLSPADFVFWRVEQQSSSMCVKKEESIDATAETPVHGEHAAAPWCVKAQQNRTKNVGVSLKPNFSEESHPEHVKANSSCFH